METINIVAIRKDGTTITGRHNEGIEEAICEVYRWITSPFYNGENSKEIVMVYFGGETFKLSGYSSEAIVKRAISLMK